MHIQCTLINFPDAATDFAGHSFSVLSRPNPDVTPFRPDESVIPTTSFDAEICGSDGNLRLRALHPASQGNECTEKACRKKGGEERRKS